MSAVMKEFEDLKDRNTKLSENIKSVADEMSSKTEVANKNLSESLMRQFSEESESLKKEIANKLKSDILNLTGAMDQLHKDTDLEVTSLRDNVNTVQEKLDDKMNENLGVIQRQIEKVSQKVNQEIEVLKVRLDAKQASKDLSGTSSSELNTVVDVHVNRTSHNTITLSGGVSETSWSHNESACSDVAHVEIPHVNNTTVESASEMPINRDSLSELSLPAFVNCNKQSVVTFMQDLDIYFELKKVPDNLKLPLVLHAIKDPFAQNWVSSEYHKIDSYQSFKAWFSKLFWNELEQSRVRCDIYQGKYDSNGGESMTGHYVRYASLAVNLQTPLTEYNLATFTKRKKRKEVLQREKRRRASENLRYFTF
jgi:hypothetical protein